MSSPTSLVPNLWTWPLYPHLHRPEYSTEILSYPTFSYSPRYTYIYSGTSQPGSHVVSVFPIIVLVVSTSFSSMRRFVSAAALFPIRAQLSQAAQSFISANL